MGRHGDHGTPAGGNELLQLPDNILIKDAGADVVAQQQGLRRERQPPAVHLPLHAAPQEAGSHPGIRRPGGKADKLHQRFQFLVFQLAQPVMGKGERTALPLKVSVLFQFENAAAHPGVPVCLLIVTVELRTAPQLLQRSGRGSQSAQQNQQLRKIGFGIQGVKKIGIRHAVFPAALIRADKARILPPVPPKSCLVAVGKEGPDQLHAVVIVLGAADAGTGEILPAEKSI